MLGVSWQYLQAGRQPSAQARQLAELYQRMTQATSLGQPKTAQALADSLRRQAEASRDIHYLLVATETYWRQTARLGGEYLNIFKDLEQINTHKWLTPSSRAILAGATLQTYEQNRWSRGYASGAEDTLIPTGWSAKEYTARYRVLLGRLFADMAVLRRPVGALPEPLGGKDYEHLSLMRYVLEGNLLGQTSRQYSRGYGYAEPLASLLRPYLETYISGVEDPDERFYISYQYLLTSEESRLALIEEHAGLPSAGPLLVRHVGQWQRRDGTQQTIERLGRYIELHSTRPEIRHALEEQVAQLRRPRLGVVTSSDQLCLNVREHLRLETQHIGHLKIELYRIPSMIARYKMWRPSEGDSPKHSYTIEVPDQERWDTVEQTIEVEYPELGSYFVRITSTLTPQARTDAPPTWEGYRHYSRYYMLSTSAGRNAVLQLLDAHTGAPIRNRQVELATDEKLLGQSSRVQETDKEGYISLMDDNSYRWFRVMDTQDPLTEALYSYAMDLSPLSLSPQREITLVVDRPAYRPGHRVHLVGYVWQVTARAEDARAERGQAIGIQVLDPNGRTMQTDTLTTDSFGRINYSYQVPTDAPLGTWSIVALNGGDDTLAGYDDRDESVYFPVIEYQRPQMEVQAVRSGRLLQIGETEEVRVLARQYNGQPIEGAQVRCRVSIHQREWGALGASRELEPMVAYTDRRGEVILPIKLDTIAPRRYEGSRLRPLRLSYWLTLEVSSPSGETVGERLGIHVGDELEDLSLNLPQYLCLDTVPRDLRFSSHGDSRQVDYMVRYEVLRDGTRVLTDSVALGAPLATDSWQRLLRSGAYQLQWTLDLPSGATYRATQGFVVYRSRDKWLQTDGEPLVLLAPRPTFGQDGRAQILYTSGLDSTYIYYRIATEGGELQRGMLRPKRNRLHRLALPKVQDRERLQVSMYTVRAGRLYSQDVELERQQPDKVLTLRWQSFRNRLRAGDTEQWRLEVLRGGKPVHSGIVSWMYDASLDAIAGGLGMPVVTPRRWVSVPGAPLWTLSHYGDLRPEPRSWFEVRGGWLDEDVEIEGEDNQKDAGEIIGLAEMATSAIYGYTALPSATPKAMNVSQPLGQAMRGATLAGDAEADAMSSPAIRTNFAETAYHYPSLETDRAGQVSWRFTLPESLTRWRVVVLANTPEMDYGVLTDDVESYRELSVRPYLPRFVRRGDEVELRCGVTNTSGASQALELRLELFDTRTQEVLRQEDRAMTLADGATGIEGFALSAPEGIDSLGVRFVAKTPSFSDGEEHSLPIEPNVTETVRSVAFTVLDGRTSRFDLGELFPSDTFRPEAGKVDIRLESNPLYLALQSLPTMLEVDSDQAIRLAEAIYAERMLYALSQYPDLRHWLEARVVAIGGGIRAHRDSLTLEPTTHTPWHERLEREAELERTTALLKALDRVGDRALEYKYIDRLKALTTSDGWLSWFAGMQGNRYVSQYALTLLVRSRAFLPDGAEDVETVRELTTGLWQAIERSVSEDIDRIKVEEQRAIHTSRGNKSAGLLPTDLIEVLYVDGIDQSYSLPESIIEFVLPRLTTVVHSLDLGAKASLVRLYAERDSEVASLLLRSLDEHLIESAEGAYFPNEPTRSYWWTNRSYQTHVRALEAFASLTPDKEGRIIAMQQWLLAQRRGVMWESTVATSDALHALLLTTGGRRPLEAGHTTARLEMSSGKTIEWRGERQGMRLDFGANDAPRSLEVRPEGTPQVWVSATARYPLPIVEDRPSGRELRAERTYMLEEIVDGKRHLRPLEAGEPLKVGDKLVVSIKLSLERDMDFVRLSDPRLGYAEPVVQIPGYTWGGGTAYYYEPRDVATNFYFDRLSRGTYYLEYSQYVVRLGVCQSPSSHLQSIYAPEYTASTGYGGELRSVATKTAD